MQHRSALVDVAAGESRATSKQRQVVFLESPCINCGAPLSSSSSSNAQFCDYCAYPGPVKSTIEPPIAPIWPVGLSLQRYLSKPPAANDSSSINVIAIEQRLIERLQSLCRCAPLRAWSVRPEASNQAGIYAIFEHDNNSLHELLFVGHGIIYKQLEAHFYGNMRGLITRYIDSFIQLEERQRRFFVAWLEEDIEYLAHSNNNLWQRCLRIAIGRCPIFNRTLEISQ